MGANPNRHYSKEDKKYSHLMEDPNVARWYNNVKRGSIVTAEVALLRLGKACEIMNTTPAELAKMSVKDATNFLLDLVTKLETPEPGKKPLQPSYIMHIVKHMRSWFKHNEIQIIQKIKVSQEALDEYGNPVRSKTQDEQSPLPEQVAKVLRVADPKQRVEVSLMTLTGVREQVMGNFRGTDGLRIKDIPDLAFDNKTKTVSFKQVPAMVIVRKTLSKMKKQYFTFLPEEGCIYVQEFLKIRMNNGEVLTPESPIVTSLHFHKENVNRANQGEQAPFSFITSRKIGDSMRTAIKRASANWRPYIFRTYFATRMQMAEADQLIINEWKVFHMGHVGTIEHVYTTGKGKLPEDLIEKMRDSFAKASEKHLVTMRKESAGISTMKAQFNKQFLVMSGYSEEEIQALGDLGSMEQEELNGLLQNKAKEDLGVNGNGHQKVVLVSELEDYIQQGWDFVRDLPPNKAIIKLPSKH